MGQTSNGIGLSSTDMLKVGGLLYSVENGQLPKTDEESYEAFSSAAWEVTHMKQNNK